MVFKPEKMKEYLLKRYPLLMIDKVLYFEAHKKITALKNVSGDEIYFMGHFPDQPVMPGVLVVEAMLQAAALLNSLTEDGDMNCEKFILHSMKKIRFLQAVFPGNRLLITAEAVGIESDRIVISAKAAVEDKIVAAGEITYGIQEHAER